MERDDDLYSFFSLAFRQKYIRRWGLMRNVDPENLAEHSSETAMLTHALAVIGNTFFNKNYDVGRAVVLALFHDIPEVYTGDLPTPVKYYSDDMRENYKIIEKNSVNKLLEKLPDELKGVYNDILLPRGEETELKNLVKTADKLCAYIKCVEEEKSGNSEFKKAKETILRSLCGKNSPELEYFMRHFMPPFEMTLDEI